MPLLIGFLLVIDKCIIALIVDVEINLKWGVWPLITQPKAINPSYLLMFFEITFGISKTPGTLNILQFFKEKMTNGVSAYQKS